jgi:bacteriocin-like protein
MTDQMPSEVEEIEQVSELTADELDQVTGGLNPQPLPPGRLRLD